MNRAGAVKRFRALHEREGAFIIPNPWDAGTARVLVSMGFEALATTSAGLDFSHGVPEGALGPEAVLEHCRVIAAAVDAPVSADLEKGFGDAPEDAAGAVRRAAETGVAGGSIEDYSGNADMPIYEMSHAVERIAAAAEAARNVPGGFVLTARAENFLYDRPDLDDTVKRLQAFEAAGADVLYAPGLHDLKAIRTVCAAVTKPVNAVMGMPGAVFRAEQLAEAGVKRISTGSALARQMYGGLMRAAREMLDEGGFTFAENAADFGQLNRIFEEYSG